MIGKLALLAFGAAVGAVVARARQVTPVEREHHRSRLVNELHEGSRSTLRSYHATQLVGRARREAAPHHRPTAPNCVQWRGDVGGVLDWSTCLVCPE